MAHRKFPATALRHSPRDDHGPELDRLEAYD
jgi:hypothetical protein